MMLFAESPANNNTPVNTEVLWGGSTDMRRTPLRSVVVDIVNKPNRRLANGLGNFFT